MVSGVKTQEVPPCVLLTYQAEHPAVGWVHIVLGSSKEKPEQFLWCLCADGWGRGGSVNNPTGSDSCSNFRNIAFAYS